MAIEIEAKMRLHHPDALVARLDELGATLTDRLSETNSYFDTAQGTLKSTDQGLRTRVEVANAGTPDETITTKITHKGPRAMGKLKSRVESELNVDNARDAAVLLGALGYQHVLSFEKRRTRYALDGCRIELDELPVIGRFIEIEGDTEDAVIAVREKLGLADEPLIKSSYIAMLKTHLQETHSSEAMIKFDDEASVVQG
ncbi:MAG: class IV adenylate cyclase [Phycisphaeraceae bacterium]